MGLFKIQISFNFLSYNINLIIFWTDCSIRINDGVVYEESKLAPFYQIQRVY